MNVSRELKKKEAIKRMEALGLFAPCIKAFKNRDEVQLTEPTGGLYEFSSNKELTAKVQEFEKEHNALVYHVIHTPTMEMDMDNADISDGYVLAYVWNTTVDYFSEFGSIAVQDRFGGLVRIS